MAKAGAGGDDQIAFSEEFAAEIGRKGASDVECERVAIKQPFAEQRCRQQCAGLLGQCRSVGCYRNGCCSGRLSDETIPRSFRKFASAGAIAEAPPIEASMTRRIGRTALAFTAALLAGACNPVYLSDTYTTATPRPASFDMSVLARQPVATLGLVAPANLQGFSPTLSLALATALAEVSPPIRGISTFESVNRLTDQGLAAEYADLLSGFVRTGILERQRLRRIGSGLGARSVMLPGLAQLDETVIDKFEAAGLKLLRNRVTTLRLWLQLWDAQSGHIVWESAGEVTVSTVLLSPKQTVPLEETVQKLLFNMIQDGLLRGKTKTEIYFD
jgi:hypothetical protein